MMEFFYRFGLAAGLMVVASPVGLADTVQTTGMASQESSSVGAVHAEPEFIPRILPESVKEAASRALQAH